MENVLDIHAQPYDLKNPKVNVDERPCQLIADVLMPIPMKPGYPQREDYHYKRNGTCVVFIAFEPLTGQRYIEVKERKTKQDYAQFMKNLKRKYYPQAKRITVIQDNLNTHNPSAFYETFDAEEAFELSRYFQMAYTPKKASWLNMAEIELSALSKQCLDRRIGNMEVLSKEVSTWARDRNRKRITVDWQFTKNKARRKLNKFYEALKN